MSYKSKNWVCECGMVNALTQKRCPHCGREQPERKEVKNIQKKELMTWFCPTCGRKNHSNYCPDCGTVMPHHTYMKVHCPNCMWPKQSEIKPKYCPDCGSLLEDNKI